MKAVKLVALIGLLSFFTSCKDTNGEYMKELYLSQSRDEALIGWWKVEESESSSYLYLAKDGSKTIFSKHNNKWDSYSGTYYWYTKDSVFFTLHYTASYWKPSHEYLAPAYKVEEGKLYLKYNEATGYAHYATKAADPR